MADDPLYKSCCYLLQKASLPKDVIRYILLFQDGSSAARNNLLFVLRLVNKPLLGFIPKELGLQLDPEEMCRFTPDFVAWARDKLKYRLCKSTFDFASYHNNFNLMKWLRTQKCKFHALTFRYASRNGNLEVMKWLKSEGCRMNYLTFSSAAEHGNLDNMKWLKDNGCPWDDRTFTRAFSHKTVNLEILQWLYANGCPWSSSTLEWAKFADVKIQNWVKENLKQEDHFYTL
jgi:hypothetical protein